MNIMLVLSSLAALHGGQAPQSQAMVVHLRDLNLRSMSGSATAVQRINAAARAFCAERPAGGAQAVDVTVLKCRRDMSARAVALLRSQQVQALYEDAPGGLLYASGGTAMAPAATPSAPVTFHLAR
jgi:UrcA family protein